MSPAQPLFSKLVNKNKNGGIKLEQKVINCPHCGRIISDKILSVKKHPSVKCPMCGSAKFYRDGFRISFLQKFNATFAVIAATGIHD